MKSGGCFDLSLKAEVNSFDAYVGNAEMFSECVASTG